MRVAALSAVHRTPPSLPATCARSRQPALRLLASPAREPLTGRLERIWSRQRVAAVQSAELPRAIDALLAHHLANGFFGNRMVGMERREGFVDGSVEVRLAPNRTKVPINRDPASHSCDLCDPPFPEERGLIWRGWRLWPNAFPYVPAEYQHILLTSADHRTQGFSPAVLNDMLDFQVAANDGRQLTLHYNGVAGHSQAHLHWQATRVLLPLQRELDAERIPRRRLLERGQGLVEAFERGPYAGFLVSGEHAFVVRQAARILDRLDRDPLTRGAYNLLLLARRGGRARLVIVPRRADNLRPVVGSLGPAGIGAFNAGGVVVVPRAELPDDFAASIGPAMRATVVSPFELAWLDELAEERHPLPSCSACCPLPA